MRVLSPTSSKRLNEVMGFVYLATGMLLLLSLVSYHAQDPSWDTAAGHVRPLNLAGPFGAHIADLALQTFGASAFLFPLLAFVTGWKWIRSEAIDTPFVRLAGFGLFLSRASARRCRCSATCRNLRSGTGNTGRGNRGADSGGSSAGELESDWRGRGRDNRHDRVDLSVLRVYFG